MDRPFLCNDSVALAIREGRQTQHRVPMRPRPLWFEAIRLWGWKANTSRGALFSAASQGGMFNLLSVAPWQPGDDGWVREAWALIHVWINPETGWGEDLEKWEGKVPKKEPGAYWAPVYRAGGMWDSNIEDRGFKWRPSIHMPRWAARTWIKIGRVWAEQVQDTSEEDARAEGIVGPGPGVDLHTGRPGYSTGRVGTFSTAREAYRVLMEAIYPGIWERNEWLWCCSFEVDRKRSGVPREVL